MKELIKKCHMNSANKGFWEDVRAIEVLYQNCIIDKKFKESMINNAIATRLALIQSEVSEALEELRKGDMENFKEELADICIRIFDLSGGLKIDLEEKILEKMKKNESRGYKHGKKF
ncbi:NTP pyrophosphatase, house-cleaning of non-canonical NTPs [Alkalithermobacter thermoalcaliphilus JW-YL-7 = DSM 7308]|uniref:MazG nucleotide pyrophosphohydrolase n=1 Tax=Alkalithermobacter thermoalcaliphilus JW-YL-7 = DSM 7308 TaxID=1121328 RepID=A0A150FS89_CLOPD|nr:MazG nucleotide pyrophosphohydrolase [[Clostridium] paradoxum JW-YL-7 = DSM 7308]SHL12855.1 NTP pyrophosphatase, house-cleaning of non-canonical NTPs [[Clostridium] paradoxum JW-YL-7 = DSM 7308]